MSIYPQPPATAPGWYRYPAVPTGMRFWDGAKFTEEFIPDPVPTNGGAGGSAGMTESTSVARAEETKREPVPAPLDSAATETPGAPNRETEGSLIGRLVAVLTPLLAVAAGWLAGVVGNAIPGVTLDKNQITAFMVAAVTAVLAAGWKWLAGWQAHEQRVASSKELPRKLAPPPKGLEKPPAPR